MTKPLKKSLGLTALLGGALAGCAIADLRPKAQSGKNFSPPSESLSLQAHPQSIPKRAAELCQGELLIKLSDDWGSSLLRRFTPLKQAKSSLELRTDFKSQHWKIQGQSEDYLIRDSNFFKKSDRLYKSESSSQSLIYFDSLYFYLSLPLRLKELEYTSKLDSITLQGKVYDRVLASFSEHIEADPDIDQMVLHFNAAKELEFAVFTYRKMFSWYQGVISYSGFKKFGEILAPSEIKILREMNGAKIDHVIHIDSISCEEKSNHLHSTWPLCPGSPNCVNSMEDSNSKFHIEALTYEGKPEDAFLALREEILKIKGSKLILDESGRLHFEIKSSTFGFVDDLEVFLDAEKKLVHFRSESRTGHSDLGVNRKRLQKIYLGLRQSKRFR